MSSRGSVVVKGRTKTQRKKKGKKRCELGAKCPYQHQYQHSLEYDHGDDSTIVSGSGLSETASSASSFQPFSGAGRTMPSEGRNNQPAPRRFEPNAAAAAAMRRASTTTSTSGAVASHSSRPVAIRQQGQDINRSSAHAISVNRNSRHQQSSVINLEDSDEENDTKKKQLAKNRKDSSETKKKTRTTRMPPKKRARETKNDSIIGDVIDLCDTSDED